MKPYLPLMSLLLIAPLRAQPVSMAVDIHQGRAALQASHPRLARALFAAALAHPDGNRDDAFAAAMGLGRSALWLSDYATAAHAFQIAKAQATTPSMRQAADIGLAQTLNAQDYPHAAYAIVAPLATTDTQATVELLHAMESMGWQDKSKPYLKPPPDYDAQSHAGMQYRRLQDDMRLALSPRVDAHFSYNHDNEKLSVYDVGAGFSFAPGTYGTTAYDWGVAVDTTRVVDNQQSQRVDSLGLTAHLRFGDNQYVDLDAGPSKAGRWNFVQGAANWTMQANDQFSLVAGAERTPILVNTAIDQRLIYDTYSFGTQLRPASHWYIVPIYYRQTFSDGNTRDGGTLRVLLSPYDVPDTAAAIGAELSTRIYRSTQPSRGVYFNPAQYRSAQFGLIGVYSLNADWKLRALAGTGRQVIDGASAGLYAASLSLTGRLPHNGRLEFRLERSSDASVTHGGSGYWNNTAMLSVTYPF